MKRPALLDVHARLARLLVGARRAGTKGTAATYRAALLTNAKVLRRKLLTPKEA